jgi:hypothetical protein
MSSQPLNEEFAVAVDKGEINQEDEAKARARTLSETWPDDWSVGDARSIWSVTRAHLEASCRKADIIRFLPASCSQFACSLFLSSIF